MKYLVIGAGGIGGPLAFYLTKGGKDVTLIARGEALKAIKEKGLTLYKDEKYESVKINACTAKEYNEKPDIIFLCVKGYSVDSILPFLEKITDEKTVVIPLLNIFTTGEDIQKHLPHTTVTDGCIYIAGNIKAPGTVEMHGDIIKVVFGLREEGNTDKLKEVVSDLRESKISATLSNNIKRDALRKFSYVSPAAACGLYFGCKADRMQKDSKEREFFIKLMEEVRSLSIAMGYDIGESTLRLNLSILDKLQPTAGTSLQLDIEKGHQSEIDGLIHLVVRLSEGYGLKAENYALVSEKFMNFN